MAKTIGVPAVVGLKEATLHIHNQDQIIVDGRKGLVYINPTDETLEKYEDVKKRSLAEKDKFADIKYLSAETKDGHKIQIMANLELADEADNILNYGAQGVGLYRTEYFYMNRTDLPSEDEQFEAYKKVAEAMGSRSVTVRTLDIGGDKFISSLQIPSEMYANLGWRAIRFCFARPDIFKTQLRALLRAAVFGNIQIMFPMISGYDDLMKAKGILEEAKQELKKAGKKYKHDVPVGIMIEVPSAALTADILAKEADFFSIGTNDLIQYTLAVDRVNEQTAELYDPGHPAVLRLIKQSIDAAHKENIEVALCGEMGNEPSLALILLGLGIDSLSMTTISILQIKKMIRSVKMEDAKKLAEKVLWLSTGKEVEQLSEKTLEKLAPDIMTSDQD